MAGAMEHVRSTFRQAMTKGSAIAAKVLAALAALTGLFFLLPNAHCCDESDPALERLIVRANAGAMDAIHALYAKARVDRVRPEEELWALEGALRNNKPLRDAYAVMFKGEANSDRRRQVLAMVQASKLPGAPCLLATLEESRLRSALCN